MNRHIKPIVHTSLALRVLFDDAFVLEIVVRDRRPILARTKGAKLLRRTHHGRRAESATLGSAASPRTSHVGRSTTSAQTRSRPASESNDFDARWMLRFRLGGRRSPTVRAPFTQGEHA